MSWRKNPDYWGTAGAGVLPVAKSTGRFLVPLRSQHVNEPGTYGTIGGKLDRIKVLDNRLEEPEEAALREFAEETGSKEEPKLVDLFVFEDPEAEFRYHNFLGMVEEEFDPQLNWETEAWFWVDLDELLALEPKHFGLEALLADQGSIEVLERAGTSMWIRLKITIYPVHAWWGFDEVHEAFDGMMYYLVQDIGTESERRGWDGTEAAYRLGDFGNYTIRVRFETGSPDPVPAIYAALWPFFAYVEEDPYEDLGEFIEDHNDRIIITLDVDPRDPAFVTREVRVGPQVIDVTERLLIPDQSYIWHITTDESAQRIFDEGFRPQDTPKGPGVSFTTNLNAARGLLKATLTMNNMRSFDEVEQWARRRGLSEKHLTITREYYEKFPGIAERRLGKKTPAGYFLRMTASVEEHVGLHAHEFLWVDLAGKLVGEDVVTIVAKLAPDAKPTLVPYSLGTESEWFVQTSVVYQIIPVTIIAPVDGYDGDDDLDSAMTLFDMYGWGTESRR